jgi:hypothetical protein
MENVIQMHLLLCFGVGDFIGCSFIEVSHMSVVCTYLLLFIGFYIDLVVSFHKIPSFAETEFDVKAITFLGVLSLHLCIVLSSPF